MAKNNTRSDKPASEPTRPVTHRRPTATSTTPSAATSPAGLFFGNDTATTEIHTLSLHDALPISGNLDVTGETKSDVFLGRRQCGIKVQGNTGACRRSEEHTSELQSQSKLVCRLLLEKKKRCPATIDQHHGEEQHAFRQTRIRANTTGDAPAANGHQHHTKCRNVTRWSFFW